MKIEIRNVADADRGAIKRDLKAAFQQPPAVVILDTQPAKIKAAIPFTVINGPKKKEEMDKVKATVDAILMRHGYKLCSSEERQVQIHRPEQSSPAWNID